MNRSQLINLALIACAAGSGCAGAEQAHPHQVGATHANAMQARHSADEPAAREQDSVLAERTLQRIDDELGALRRRGADAGVIADYEVYRESVKAMLERELESNQAQATAREASGTGLSPVEPYEPRRPTRNGSGSDADREFRESLGEFDDYLSNEQAEATRWAQSVEDEIDEQMTDLAQEAAAAVERLRQKGINVDTRTPPEGAQGREGQEGLESPESDGEQQGTPPGAQEEQGSQQQQGSQEQRGSQGQQGSQEQQGAQGQQGTQQQQGQQSASQGGQGEQGEGGQQGNQNASGASNQQRAGSGASGGGAAADHQEGVNWGEEPGDGVGGAGEPDPGDQTGEDRKGESAGEGGSGGAPKDDRSTDDGEDDEGTVGDERTGEGRGGSPEGSESESTGRGTDGTGNREGGSKSGGGSGSEEGASGGGGSGPGEESDEQDEEKAARDRSGADDDIVARQLREAAERETDPELKRKLWEEYDRYKGNR